MRKGLGSPIRRARHPKAWLAGGVAAVVATAGLVATTATPAAADPATTYVAVGSDTIQDVMNAFAAIIGAGAVGSWDAVNPGNPTATHDIINPKAGCSMTRPNGSGEGLAALRKSLNPGTGAGQLADPPEQNCVDFSRSSSGPGGNADPNNGQLVYIPFALDAVAITTGGTTNIAHADEFNVAELTALYACTPTIVGGVTYDPNTIVGAGNTPIHLYVPQAGSGTRSYWAGQLGGFNIVTLPACVHDVSVTTGVPVQEHDGTVFLGDPDAIGPFSIAQWVSQAPPNNHNDRRHGAVLHSLAAGSTNNQVQPLVGGALNTAYPLTREVYNVVKLSRVTSGQSDFDPNLTSLLVGSTSLLCNQSLTIRSYGFATLATAPLGHTCGAVAANLRAVATL